MNLYSWLWLISWIGSCLLTQSLLKAAHASPQLPNSIISSRYRSPLIAASMHAPSGATETTLGSSSPNGVIHSIDSVFSLSNLPGSKVPSNSPLPATVIPATSASLSLPELVKPTPTLPFDLLQTPSAPASNSLTSSTTPNRLLQLVTNLSRWTKGISEALRITAPLVTVVPINPQPLEVDRWNVLELGDLSVPPAQAADFPQQPCLSEALDPVPLSLTSLFQVQVRGKPIAEFPTQQQAERWAERLRQVIQMDNFDPQTLKPVLVDGTPGGKAGDVPLFWIEPELALQLNRSAELLAISWINNLRTALNVPTLSLVESQKQMHGLVATDDRLEGTASWYGPYFHGRLTATGETFDQTELTAAHPSLPFDTYLKVTNLQTGKAVIVRINDRGPYFEDRSLDLSREAARCLNSEISGVVPYEAVIMKRSSGIFDTAPIDQAPAEEPPQTAAEETIAADESAQTTTPTEPEAEPQPVDLGSAEGTPSSETTNPEPQLE